MTTAQHIRQSISALENSDLPLIRVGYITTGGLDHQRLDEGKWISGRFPDNIRIDRATHMQLGDQHAHIYGRKGGDPIIVVTDKGKGSHGTKGRLHPEDAEALRRRGFDIPPDNIVEWILVSDDSIRQILLG